MNEAVTHVFDRLIRLIDSVVSIALAKKAQKEKTLFPIFARRTSPFVWL